MNRILVFHGVDEKSTKRLGPTYYIEADYESVAVRIHAETAPLSDAKVDIFDDGVSIFADNASRTYSAVTGYSSNTPATEAVLSAGENGEEDAEDFSGTPIEKGSWVHCNVVNHGGGKNFTVQLELRQVSEDDESED